MLQEYSLDQRLNKTGPLKGPGPSQGILIFSFLILKFIVENLKNTEKYVEGKKITY